MRKHPKKRKISAEEYEEAILKAHAQVYVLRLFVSGVTPTSIQAIQNIKRICEEYLPEQYELEVIDIYQQPSMAVSEQIVAAPTLVKKFPPPLCRLIGNLSDTERALEKLDLEKNKE